MMAYCTCGTLSGRHSRKKKGRSDSNESDGLFLIRRGHPVSQAVDLTWSAGPFLRRAAVSLSLPHLWAAALTSHISAAQDLTPGQSLSRQNFKATPMPIRCNGLELRSRLLPCRRRWPAKTLADHSCLFLTKLLRDLPDGTVCNFYKGSPVKNLQSSSYDPSC